MVRVLLLRIYRLVNLEMFSTCNQYRGACLCNQIFNRFGGFKTLQT